MSSGLGHHHTIAQYSARSLPRWSLIANSTRRQGKRSRTTAGKRLPSGSPDTVEVGQRDAVCRHGCKVVRDQTPRHRKPMHAVGGAAEPSRMARHEPRRARMKRATRLPPPRRPMGGPPQLGIYARCNRATSARRRPMRRVGAACSLREAFAPARRSSPSRARNPSAARHASAGPAPPNSAATCDTGRPSRTPATAASLHVSTEPHHFLLFSLIDTPAAFHALESVRLSEADPPVAYPLTAGTAARPFSASSRTLP